MADDKPTVVSRSEAREKGLKRYFTGRPCKHGHVDQRQVSNGICVSCFANITKSFRARHPERVRERNRRYSSARPEWRREQGRKHYAANKQDMLARAADWVARNPEKSRAMKARYKRNHPHVVKADKSKRRAKIFAAGGSHTAEDVRQIVALQGGKCAYCRTKLRKYHVDHIQPLAKGGSNARSNLQMLCGPCNLRKGSRDPVFYAQSIGMLL